MRPLTSGEAHNLPVLTQPGRFSPILHVCRRVDRGRSQGGDRIHGPATFFDSGFDAVGIGVVFVRAGRMEEMTSLRRSIPCPPSRTPLRPHFRSISRHRASRTRHATGSRRRSRTQPTKQKSPRKDAIWTDKAGNPPSDGALVPVQAPAGRGQSPAPAAADAVGPAVDRLPLGKQSVAVTVDVQAPASMNLNQDRRSGSWSATRAPPSAQRFGGRRTARRP